TDDLKDKSFSGVPNAQIIAEMPADPVHLALPAAVRVGCAVRSHVAAAHRRFRGLHLWRTNLVLHPRRRDLQRLDELFNRRNGGVSYADVQPLVVPELCCAEQPVPRARRVSGGSAMALPNDDAAGTVRVRGWARL